MLLLLRPASIINIRPICSRAIGVLIFVMSKKSQTKVIKKSLGTSEDRARIESLFNGMMGEGEPELRIICPKYDRIVKNINAALVSLSMISKIPGIGEYETKRVREFLDTAIVDEGDLWTYHIKEVEWKVKGILSEPRHAKFLEVYKNLKTSRTVRAIILICDNLAPHRVMLRDEKVGDAWINSITDMAYYPFPFSPTFDVKGYYFKTDDGSNMTTLLRKIFNCAHDIYRDVTNPDIDVDEFVSVISGSLNGMRKIPELSRCDKAFNIIIESLDTLKDRFGNYYRDFVSTKDPTIMIQHFILDIAKEQTAGDPEVSGQFKRILAYYKKTSAAATSKDPNMSTLFKKVNEQIGVLDDLELKNMN